MSIVTLNKGAQITKPSDYYDNGAFDDFVGSVAAFATGGTTALSGTHGSALLLDGSGRVELGSKSLIYKPTAGESFAAATRTKVVHGTPMSTVQNMMFSTSGALNAAERIGFKLSTASDSTFVVSCEFDDATTDSSVTLAESELPGGSGFDYTDYHEYSVLVEVDASNLVSAKYYIDKVLVKTIRVSGVSGWDADGLMWAQNNLTLSSTVDQAVDWISVGASLRP